MDIKSPLAKYSAIVARPVDVGAIRESIKLLLEGKVKYEFRTTVVKALLSPEDIEQIGKEIRGATAYYLQKFIPTKILNPQFIRKTTYTEHEFEHFKKILSSYVNFCGIR
jgi:pyruvate formate lyase activating enzyme